MSGSAAEKLAARWWDSRFAALDLETTSPDPLEARIVTASLVLVVPRTPPMPRTWMADPGIEIPEGATAVHGITTERARREGEPAEKVVREVVEDLTAVWREGCAVVGFNASYDLTVLRCEAERYGVPFGAAATLMTAAGASMCPVVDPFVLDKHLDKYRKGSRKLGALCEVYKARLDAAHDASADAIAAARLAWRMMATTPLGELPLHELHAKQIGWFREQAESLEQHLRKTKPDAVVPREWPMRPGSPR